MDISELRPMLQAVYELLRPGESFVFSTHHPCFERPADKYMTSCAHEREAIQRQPVPVGTVETGKSVTGRQIGELTLLSWNLHRLKGTSTSA